MINQEIKEKSFKKMTTHINWLNKKFDENFPLILASESPRRKHILQSLGLQIKVIPSHIPEDNIEGTGEVIARTLANLKARSVAAKHNGMIIGADTVVILDDIILGKPQNESEARQMLTQLSGNSHSVVTGIAVINTSNCHKIITSIKSRVTFRVINEQEIDSYILSKEPMDKAGAYAIQGKGSNFITKLEGSYTNVIGLPISECLECLAKLLNYK